MRRARFFLLAPFILLAVLVFIALGGVVVQSLWNWLLQSLFGLPVVTFWQALGLLALSAFCSAASAAAPAGLDGAGGRITG